MTSVSAVYPQFGCSSALASSSPRAKTQSLGRKFNSRAGHKPPNRALYERPTSGNGHGYITGGPGRRAAGRGAEGRGVALTRAKRVGWARTGGLKFP